jgi:hypothetical protein
MNDKDHADSLSRTTATITSPQFRDVVELARKSELPLEAVLSIYKDHTSGWQKRAPVPSELDMSNSAKILPGHSAELTAKRKLEWGTFAVSHLEIDGNPADWRIEQFKIGNREQLHRGSEMKLVPVSGCYFNDCIRGRVEIAGQGMDVVLVVTYLGTNPEGESFAAKFYGTAA